MSARHASEPREPCVTIRAADEFGVDRDKAPLSLSLRSPHPHRSIEPDAPRVIREGSRGAALLLAVLVMEYWLDA